MSNDQKIGDQDPVELLANRVVVITGGAGLIGRQFSAAVVQSGGLVVVADIDIDAANQVANEITAKLPGRAEAAQLDIADIISIRRLIDDIRSRHGRIDALVNNAYPRNSGYGRKLEDVSYADFCENVSLNLGGLFLTSQQFALDFQKQGFGNIINIASIYGVVAPRFEIYDGTHMTMPVEYAAIKSAVIHLTKYYAKYFQGSNLRVNCISPGGIKDGQPESFLVRYKSYALNKGMLDAQDLTGVLLFLLSDMSMYVNGQNFVVDDGYSL